MAYKGHFKLVDDVSTHFDSIVGGANPFLQSRYVGFYAVASAAVLELSLKQIICDFAKQEHSLFGNYISVRYERINGRISVKNIVDEHLKPFGARYQGDFEKRLNAADSDYITKHQFSVKSSYQSLLTCRHKFAHEGAVPATLTYAEVKKGFLAGKAVMECLASALVP